MIFTKIKDINFKLLLIISLIFIFFYFFNFDLKVFFYLSTILYLIFSIIYFFIYKNNIPNFFIIINTLYILLGHFTLDYFYVDRAYTSNAYEQILINDFISLHILNFLFIYFNHSSKKVVFNNTKDKLNYENYYYLCYLLVLIGYFIFFLFIKNFDYFEFFKVSRIQRAKEVQDYLDQNINLPYSYLFFVSFALCSNLFFRGNISKRKYLLFIFFLIPYCLSIFIEGDRSVILYFLLPTIYIYYTYNTDRIIKNISLIVPLFIIFILIGLYRGPITEYLKTDSSDYLKLRTNQIIDNPMNLIPAEFSSVTWAKVKSVEYNIDYNGSFSTFFISFFPNDIFQKTSASSTLSAELKLRKHNRSLNESPGFNYYLEWYDAYKEFGVIIITIFVYIIIQTYNKILINLTNPLTQSILFCFIVHLFSLMRSNIQGVMNSIILYLLVFCICIFFIYLSKIIKEVALLVKEKRRN